MAVLITGGAGFVGSHLVDVLLRESEDQLVVIDNFNDYYAPEIKRQNAARWANNPRVALFEGDFADNDFLGHVFARHQFRYIAHLGAYAGVPYSLLHPEHYMSANVAGTVALLEAARQQPVERFLLASSSTVYGRGTPTPFCEDGPLGLPLSPYAASKRAAELMGSTWHGMYGSPVVSLRLFNVYGPRLRPELALAVFAKKVLEGRPIPLFGDGSVRRDFTHVSDVCRGIIAAMTAPNVAGEAINIGNDHPIEIRELIRLIEEAAGKRAVIDYQPPRSEDMPATHADLTKARRLLNYQPRVPLAEGVREYVEWLRTTL